MILVDASALIPFLRGTDTAATRCLAQAIEADVPLYLTPIGVQEVLQGARDEQEWRRLDSYLSTQPLIEPEHALGTCCGAARIYVDCRRRGLTVRGTIDCLIAQPALHHDWVLLDDDRDYEIIRRVRPLRTIP